MSSGSIYWPQLYAQKLIWHAQIWCLGSRGTCIVVPWNTTRWGFLRSMPSRRENGKNIDSAKNTMAQADVIIFLEDEYHSAMRTMTRSQTDFIIFVGSERFWTFEVAGGGEGGSCGGCGEDGSCGDCDVLFLHFIKWFAMQQCHFRQKKIRKILKVSGR